MPANSQAEDAIALLEQDHKEVEALFKQFETAKDENQKMAIAERICLALKVHTQIEEELFYPAMRSKADEKDIDEALVEHKGAKQLVAEIEESGEIDAMFEAKVQVLGEQVTHHIEEEREKLFPQARKAKIDLADLGAQLARRKQELMQDYESDLADGARGEGRSFTGGGQADLQPDEDGGKASSGSGKHESPHAR